MGLTYWNYDSGQPHMQEPPWKRNSHPIRRFKLDMEVFDIKKGAAGADGGNFIPFDTFEARWWFL